MAIEKQSHFKRVRVESQKLMLVTGKESPVFKIENAITWQNIKTGNPMPKLTITIVESNSDYPHGEGESIVYIPTSLVVSKLNDLYPNEGYVGRLFSITQLPKPKGAKFFDVELNECVE